jgi:hypothetical protein
MGGILHQTWVRVLLDVERDDREGHISGTWFYSNTSSQESKVGNGVRWVTGRGSADLRATGERER